MEEPTSAEVVHAALDALLGVVAASAEDLRRFHDAVTKARLAPLPPFPRTSVLLTKHIIEHLTLVDQELEHPDGPRCDQDTRIGVAEASGVASR